LLLQAARTSYARITVEIIIKEITRRKIVMKKIAPNLSG